MAWKRNTWPEHGQSANHETMENIETGVEEALQGLQLPEYHVGSYGVKGNGTNSTTAMKSLMATVKANGGGKIVFGSGTYAFDWVEYNGNTPTEHSPIIVEGQGKSTEIRPYTTVGTVEGKPAGNAFFFTGEQNYNAAYFRLANLFLGFKTNETVHLSYEAPIIKVENYGNMIIEQLTGYTNGTGVLLNTKSCYNGSIRQIETTTGRFGIAWVYEVETQEDTILVQQWINTGTYHTIVRGPSDGLHTLRFDGFKAYTPYYGEPGDRERYVLGRMKASSESAYKLVAGESSIKLKPGEAALFEPAAWAIKSFTPENSVAGELLKIPNAKSEGFTTEQSFVFTELNGKTVNGETEGGVVVGRTYYVRVPTSGEFKFAETPEGAAVKFTTEIKSASSKVAIAWRSGEFVKNGGKVYKYINATPSIEPTSNGTYWKETSNIELPIMIDPGSSQTEINYVESVSSEELHLKWPVAFNHSGPNVAIVAHGIALSLEGNNQLIEITNSQFEGQGFGIAVYGTQMMTIRNTESTSCKLLGIFHGGHHDMTIDAILASGSGYVHNSIAENVIVWVDPLEGSFSERWKIFRIVPPSGTIVSTPVLVEDTGNYTAQIEKIEDVSGYTQKIREPYSQAGATGKNPEDRIVYGGEEKWRQGASGEQIWGYGGSHENELANANGAMRFSGPFTAKEGTVFDSTLPAALAVSPKVVLPLSFNPYDLSGNGNNGVLGGSPVFTRGRYGTIGAIEFAGSQYVETPFKLKAANFTFFGWYYRNELGGANEALLGQSTSNELLFRIKASSEEAGFWSHTTGQGGTGYWKNVFPAGKWTPWALVWEEGEVGVTSGIATLWVNGVSQGAKNVNGAVAMTTGTITLGQRGGGGEKCKGKHGLFGVTESILTQTQIEALAGKPTVEQGGQYGGFEYSNTEVLPTGSVSHIYQPAKYGIVADGVTDDTAGWERLDAALPLEGPVFIHLTGISKLSKKIELHANKLAIIGNGYDTCGFILAPGSNSNVLRFGKEPVLNTGPNRLKSLQLENFSVWHNGYEQRDAAGIAGAVVIYGADDVHVDIKVHEPRSTGIAIIACKTVNVGKCRISDLVPGGAGNGIDISGSGTTNAGYTTITGAELQDIPQRGIDVNPSNSIGISVSAMVSRFVNLLPDVKGSKNVWSFHPANELAPPWSASGKYGQYGGTLKATTTSTSTVLTEIPTWGFALLWVGAVVTGAGIPVSTTITELKESEGKAVMSAKATESHTLEEVTSNSSFSNNVFVSEGGFNYICVEENGPSTTLGEVKPGTNNSVWKLQNKPIAWSLGTTYVLGQCCSFTLPTECNLPAQSLNGDWLLGGTTVNFTALAENINTPPVLGGSFKGTVTSGSEVITEVSSFTNLAVGSYVRGAGFVGATIVELKAGESKAVMSGKATATHSKEEITVAKLSSSWSIGGPIDSLGSNPLAIEGGPNTTSRGTSFTGNTLDGMNAAGEYTGNAGILASSAGSGGSSTSNVSVVGNNIQRLGIAVATSGGKTTTIVGNVIEDCLCGAEIGSSFSVNEQGTAISGNSISLGGIGGGFGFKVTKPLGSSHTFKGFVCGDFSVDGGMGPKTITQQEVKSATPYTEITVDPIPRSWTAGTMLLVGNLPNISSYKSMGVVTLTLEAEAGATVLHVKSWTPEETLASGAAITPVQTALSAELSGTVTSLPVVALPFAIQRGVALFIPNSTGTKFYRCVTNEKVAAGATSIPISSTSVTAAAGAPVGIWGERGVQVQGAAVGFNVHDGQIQYINGNAILVGEGGGGIPERGIISNVNAEHCSQYLKVESGAKLIEVRGGGFSNCSGEGEWPGTGEHLVVFRNVEGITPSVVSLPTIESGKELYNSVGSDCMVYLTAGTGAVTLKLSPHLSGTPTEVFKIAPETMAPFVWKGRQKLKLEYTGSPSWVGVGL